MPATLDAHILFFRVLAGAWYCVHYHTFTSTSINRFDLKEWTERVAVSLMIIPATIFIAHLHSSLWPPDLGLLITPPQSCKQAALPILLSCLSCLTVSNRAAYSFSFCFVSFSV